MAKFTSTSTGCADITYIVQNLVVTESDDLSLGFQAVIINGGNVEIHPTDIGKKATYTFDLYTEVTGGFN